MLNTCFSFGSLEFWYILGKGCLYCCYCCLVAKSYQTLQPHDCSPWGSYVQGIPYTRILKWVSISLSRGPSQPRDQTPVSCWAGRFFFYWAIWEVPLYDQHLIKNLRHCISRAFLVDITCDVTHVEEISIAGRVKYFICDSTGRGLLEVWTWYP